MGRLLTFKLDQYIKVNEQDNIEINPKKKEKIEQ